VQPPRNNHQVDKEVLNFLVFILLVPSAGDKPQILEHMTFYLEIQNQSPTAVKVRDYIFLPLLRLCETAMHLTPPNITQGSQISIA